MMKIENPIISTIIPVYKGNRYIPMQLHQIEIAACVAGVGVEVIFSNDYPEEELCECIESEYIDISYLQTNVNRGIQGARVTGSAVARGEFVLFLDQDDKISSNYFKSQLEAFGDADACVCDCIINGKNRYSEWNASLSESITEKYNLEVGCGFTVGQTLIKRSSIPEYWKNNWLNNNYCDDYYLWLCMFSESRKFVANPEVLYEHVNTGANQSNDYGEWFKSSIEMLHKLTEGKIFPEKEIDLIRGNIDKEVAFHLADIKYLKEKNWAYSRLLLLMENPSSFDLTDNRLDLKGYKIAVYGADLGIHLCNLLKKNNISPVCIIDRNAVNIRADIQTCTIDMIPDTVTMIINTLFRDIRAVEDNIKALCPNVRYCHICDVLNDACSLIDMPLI